MAGAKPGVHVVQLKPIFVPEPLTRGSKFIMWNDVSKIISLLSGATSRQAVRACDLSLRLFTGQQARV